MWKGLESRWNKALTFAETFLDDAPAATSGAATPVAFSAAAAVVAKSTAAGAATDSAPMGPPAAAPPAQPPLALPQSPVAIKALRIGSQGDLVRAWQSFLKGRGYDAGGLDGDFGDKTEVATEAFQTSVGLQADGIAGRQTLMKAMGLGFELIEEPAGDTSGSNFPPRPDFPPLPNTAARQALFGAYDYVPAPQPGDREHIRILGTWVADNLVTVPIPQLKRALGSKAPSGIQFHRLAAAQLQGLWKDWEAAGLLSLVLSYDGSFASRFIRGSTSSLSGHAFGSAFDINAAQNTLGSRPPLVGERGSTRALVPIANKWGFYWGGHFGSRPDGMHFEIAFLSPAAGP